MYRNVNIIQSGGVELRGLKASLAPRRQQFGNDPKLERYTFIPYESSVNSEAIAVHVCVHIALENSYALKMRVAEIVSEPEEMLATQIASVLDQEPMIHVRLLSEK
jgi:fatty acid synthase